MASLRLPGGLAQRISIFYRSAISAGMLGEQPFSPNRGARTWKRFFSPMPRGPKSPSGSWKNSPNSLMPARPGILRTSAIRSMRPNSARIRSFNIGFVAKANEMRDHGRLLRNAQLYLILDTEVNSYVELLRIARQAAL